MTSPNPSEQLSLSLLATPVDEPEKEPQAPAKDPDYYRIDPKTGEKTEITRSEFKDYRRKHVTRTYQIIPMCGHKFIPGEVPRHNHCEACWFTFFQVHGELTQAVEELFQKPDGERIIKQLKGKNFFKNWLKFMSSVAHLQETLAVAQATKENNVVSTNGTELGSGIESEDLAAESRLTEEARASRAIIDGHLKASN